MSQVAHRVFNPFTSDSIINACNVVLTFESINEILWCDHSNETSLAVPLHSYFVFKIIPNKMKLEIFLEF